MLDPQQIFPLNFLAYGGTYTGDHHGMRYRLRRVGEKPDYEIEASVWPEPFCYDQTPEAKRTDTRFPFSEEGREAAIAWLAGEYDSRREEWDQTPRI